VRWDDAAGELGFDPRVSARAHVVAPAAALHSCIEADAGILEQEERLAVLIGALSKDSRWRMKGERRAPDAGITRLERAREYISAHAIAGVTLGHDRTSSATLLSLPLTSRST
jgi:hypothetical protein